MKHSVRERRLLRTTFIVALMSLMVAVFVACDAANSLVGGACAAGFLECTPGECVDVISDPGNCGKCGNTCSAGVACVGGVCGGSIDGSIDGANDGNGGDGNLDGNLDGQNGDGQSSDGALSEGSTDDGSASDGNVGDACIPPFNTAQHCGACNIVCSGMNSVCNPVDGGFACGPFCTDPLFPTNCSGVCVDLTSDPNNCGTCGKICASGICVTSLCQGTTPGSVVAIGHDFSGAANSTAPAKLLTNAVFIPSSNPVRVLSYEQFANPTAVTGAKAVINAGGVARNRMVAYTVSNTAADLAVLGLEVKYDVILIYDQATLTAAEAATDGANDAAALLQFTKAGGVVIALDGANGEEAMPPFLTNAGLLTVTGHTFLPTTPPPPTHATVVAPADFVGAGVVSPYAVAVRSVSFMAEPESGTVTYVVKSGSTPDPLGDPIVVHKIVP